MIEPRSIAVHFSSATCEWATPQWLFDALAREFVKNGYRLKPLVRLILNSRTYQLAATGPPEIRRSSEEANELARALGRLSEDNRGLLRKIVSLQDDERRDIARDLHDELGPLLFGIRANAVALQDGAPQ